MKLTFLGATGTVTGSKYLLQDGGMNILVDCGLFQGLKELRLRNWEGLPFSARDIDAVILTHAHLDHSGYIPRLVKAGFRGRIYCSEATMDLCAILLPDSGHIQEEDAERANRYSYTKHKPALPLYTRREAEKALEYFTPVPFGQRRELGGGTGFTLHRAGHILGAAFVRVSDGGGTSILFSGDIGRPDDPVMVPPARIQDADYIVVESTYGDRLHDKTDPADVIAAVVGRTAARGGTVVIPAFAVGRAQSIMYYLYRLKEEGRIDPNLPVYLDSPMAIDASGLLRRHMNDHRMTGKTCAGVCGVAEYIHTRDESKSLYGERNHMPKVIISASGMATGGRVLHHLKHYVGDKRNAILLAGFQAAGTRGDRLARGEPEIKIHGRMWPVRADIVRIDNMSAHADYEEILQWLGHFTSAPRRVFVTHGERSAAESLKARIEKALGWPACVPAYGQSEKL